jgi:peptidoglycan/xylan/chitin deacetylase (PgdA/CDA1 family)
MTGLRRLLKRLALGVYRQIAPRGASSRTVVLCYHSIHSKTSFASAAPDLFAQHLIWLKQHCTIVPFSQVLTAVSGNGERRPCVAITFDDGYVDNYECAFPLLQRYEVPATFFLTVGFMERDPAVVERFRSLRRTPGEKLHSLTWPQVREMRQLGMEFGAHTYSHPNLARLDRPAAEVELRRSKEIMEEQLGQRIGLLAYPFGRPKLDFTAKTIDLVAQVGYESAAATTSRAVRVSDGRFAIPRFFATGLDVRTLASIVRGDWDVLGYWQERAPLFLQRRDWSPVERAAGV